MYPETDVVYLYDGSYAGFLSCVFESFAQKELPFGIWPEDTAPSTLFLQEFIPTDPQRAQRVNRSLRGKLGARTQELVTYAFLHGSPDKERRILQFLQFAYATGPRACYMLGNEMVAPVLEMEKAVRNEGHFFMEFARFEEQENMLGAVIAPKHYVLPLLRRHFCSRMPDENFVIYDSTHKAALVYQNYLAEYRQLAQELTLPPAGKTEQEYQALWKAFYRTIAIPERENPLLRRTHCPKRYWVNMTELKEEA